MYAPVATRPTTATGNAGTTLPMNIPQRATSAGASAERSWNAANAASVDAAVASSRERRRGRRRVRRDEDAGDRDGAGRRVQTVYATFGAKRDPVRAARPDGGGRRPIAFTSRFYAKGGDLIEVARTASALEPDLAAMWSEGESRRRRAAVALVAEWKRDRMPAEGVSERAAADLLSALTGPDVFRLLVVERGWSRKRLEAWQAATLEQALLRCGGRYSLRRAVRNASATVPRISTQPKSTRPGASSASPSMMAATAIAPVATR